MPGKKLVLDGWFSIGTGHQSDIEDRAREKFGPDGEDPEERKVWFRKNLIDDQGEITRKGWDVLVEDMRKLEENALGWLRKNFEGARDEGHDGVGDLVGGFWFDARNPKQLEVMLVGVEHGINESDFDLNSNVWKGLSKFGGSFLDVSINLNVSEEVRDKANALEAWERTERRSRD